MAFGRSQMVIDNDVVLNNSFEAFAEKIDVFNKGQNAITMRSENIRGDLNTNTFWDNLSAGGVTARDTTSAAAASEIEIKQSSEVSVKFNGKFGPVNFTDDQLKKTQFSEAELAMSLGRKYAEGRMLSMRQSAIAAAVALLTKAAATQFDPSATLVFTHLLDTANKLGDFQDQVALWVMHSFSFNLLRKEFATPSTTFDSEFTQMTFGSGRIEMLGGIPVYVVDDANLIDAVPVPDIHMILGILPGAIEIVESEEVSMLQDVTLGGENVKQTMQGEFAYNVRLKNCAYDDTGHVGAVTNATLLDSTNWTDNNTSIKTGIGVVLLSDD